MSTPEDRALTARELPQETLPAPVGESSITPFASIRAFEDAQRVAKALMTADIVPQQFRGNMGNTLIAMEMATRTRSSVLAVMQNLYVVHGRPGWSGAYCIAALNQSGRFAEPIRFEFQGKEGSDDWGCRAIGTSRGGHDLVGPLVTIAIAKAEGWYNRQGSKWKTMPELMLRYRAATWFARTQDPGLLMGMQTVEELQDVGLPPEQPRAPVTINDLMAGQGQAGTGAAPPAEEPKSDKRQSPPADDPGKPAEREWPKWVPNEGGGGHWVEEHGVIYDPEVHAGYTGLRPPLNADGTFRARKGMTKEAAIRLEEARRRRENPPPPAGEGEGEPGDSGGVGPKQDDAGAGDQAAAGEAGAGDPSRTEELTRQAIAIIERCTSVDQLNEQEPVALDMVRGTGGVKAVEDAAVRKYRALSTVPDTRENGQNNARQKRP